MTGRARPSEYDLQSHIHLMSGETSKTRPGEDLDLQENSKQSASHDLGSNCIEDASDANSESVESLYEAQDTLLSNLDIKHEDFRDVAAHPSLANPWSLLVSRFIRSLLLRPLHTYTRYSRLFVHKTQSVPCSPPLSFVTPPIYNKADCSLVLNAIHYTSHTERRKGLDYKLVHSPCAQAFIPSSLSYARYWLAVLLLTYTPPYHTPSVRDD